MPGLISTEENKIIRKILIPVYESPEAHKAIIWYVNNLKLPGDLIIFLHVVEPILPSALSGLSSQYESMPFNDKYHISEKNMNKARLLCQELVHEANIYGIKSEAMIQVDTKPGPAIIKTINEQHIDNIIMLKRSLGFIKRAITGSVSSYVLHHSNVPVTILSSMNN
uniref:ER6-like protein n=1 Tax=Schistosoma mansoni TaxID=6183 RepID=A0A3Q0KMR5_SCHMA